MIPTNFEYAPVGIYGNEMFDKLAYQACLLLPKRLLMFFYKFFSLN